MAIESFTRREQKYIISSKQYEALLSELTPFMRADKYGVNGCYTVTSLYFDNPGCQIYYETKNKLPFRQKLRLRVYDSVDINSNAFFEIKQKHKKVVNKRRMVIPLYEAERYLAEIDENISLLNYETSNLQVLKEIDYFRSLYELKPEMIISYDRKALHGIDDDELRLTFDFNLRCRHEDLSLVNGPYGDHFINPDDVILEVKVNDSVPLWLTRILQDLECEQRSASKYCTSFELLKERILLHETQFEPIAIGGR